MRNVSLSTTRGVYAVAHVPSASHVQDCSLGPLINPSSANLCCERWPLEAGTSQTGSTHPPLHCIQLHSQLQRSFRIAFKNLRNRARSWNVAQLLSQSV